MKPIILIVLLLLPVGAASAHSGGKDKNGCHTNRKTGEKHCHGISPNSSVRSSFKSDTTKPINSEVYFSSCLEARKAGYSRLKPSDPGYRLGLDRDNDGIACE